MITYTVPDGLEETRFDDGGLWYRYQGKPIRSVGKILNRIYPMPPDLPKWYLERGKLVHAATVLIDAGTLDWEGLDNRLLPFCHAYRDFIGVAKPVIEASELTVVHPSYSFGGRLDRVFRIPGRDRLILTDLKCGMGKEDRYFLQCAALVVALDEANAEKYDIALLNLDNKGKPHFTVENDPGKWIQRWRQILQDDVKAGTFDHKAVM